MGCLVENGFDGTELQVHRFDSKEAAVQYVMVARRYEFDRHETWGFTQGIDLYRGPDQGDRASVRFHHAVGYWEAVFWTGRPGP